MTWMSPRRVVDGHQHRTVPHRGKGCGRPAILSSLTGQRKCPTMETLTLTQKEQALAPRMFLEQ